MSRKLHLPILLIGLALIIMPFAISLPSKASAGQKMIDNFHPIMQRSSVSTTVDYYNKTFVPLRAVAQGGAQAATETAQLVQALATQLHMTPAQVQQFLQGQFPAMAQLLAALPNLQPVFTKVPPGLDHYKPLVDTMQANVSNYSKIDSLPDFRLFTWFFVIPGILLVLFSGWGLLAKTREPASVAQPSARVPAA